YERKLAKLKFSYKWVEGKHKAAIPKTGLEAIKKIVTIGVAIEEGTTVNLSTFEQRMLHHLNVEIVSQKKSIQ
ncbi:hypothetical protein J1N35_046052, partial [Gossypium stocksii]